jgi:hypothetical protein
MSITKWRWPVVFTTLLMAVLLGERMAVRVAEAAPAVPTNGVKATLQQLPLSFIENEGPS